MRKQIDTNGHDFDIWQIDADTNGNSRYVVHYLVIPFTEDDSQPFWVNQSSHIEHAKDMLHGQKYRAKWFGGGIVFQAYAGDPVRTVRAAIHRAETGKDLIHAFNTLPA